MQLIVALSFIAFFLFIGNKVYTELEVEATEKTELREEVGKLKKELDECRKNFGECSENLSLR